MNNFTSTTQDVKSHEVTTTRIIDGITYTVIARSSETATQTLPQKLDAIISREIAKKA